MQHTGTFAFFHVEKAVRFERRLAHAEGKPGEQATMTSRSRSASPAREEPRAKKQKTGGFKWKEGKSKAEGEDNKRKDGALERGYRDRSPKRARSPRGREGEQSEEGTRIKAPKGQDAGKKQKDEQEPARTTASTNDIAPTPHTTQGATTTESTIPSVADKFGASYKARAPPKTSTPTTNTPEPSQTKETKRTKKPSAPKPSNEPMIIVNINDRLGTKAAIPCLASDSVKAFKAIVAAHIGRQPHDIMLNRQGERPFKDQLSLEDYGVSNGVQLDLELDTGD